MKFAKFLRKPFFTEYLRWPVPIKILPPNLSNLAKCKIKGITYSLAIFPFQLYYSIIILHSITFAILCIIEIVMYSYFIHSYINLHIVNTVVILKLIDRQKEPFPGVLYRNVLRTLSNIFNLLTINVPII